jgi:hypothetical protein
MVRYGVLALTGLRTIKEPGSPTKVIPVWTSRCPQKLFLCTSTKSGGRHSLDPSSRESRPSRRCQQAIWPGEERLAVRGVAYLSVSRQCGGLVRTRGHLAHRPFPNWSSEARLAFSLDRHWLCTTSVSLTRSHLLATCSSQKLCEKPDMSIYGTISVTTQDGYGVNEH